jgi:hypothetical protein
VDISIAAASTSCDGSVSKLLFIAETVFYLSVISLEFLTKWQIGNPERLKTRRISKIRFEMLFRSTKNLNSKCAQLRRFLRCGGF